MIHTNQWTPDTCTGPGCTVAYTWDDSVPTEQRVHTPIQVVNQCPSHSGANYADPMALYNQIISENQRKNKALAQLQAIDASQYTIDIVPGLTIPCNTGFDSDVVGGILSQYVQNNTGSWKFSGTWNFDQNRVLNIQTVQPALTGQTGGVNTSAPAQGQTSPPTTAQQLQAFCDSTFGAGTTVIS